MTIPNNTNIIIGIYKNLRNHQRFILIFSLIIALLTGLYVYIILDPIYLSSSSLKVATKQSGLAGLVGGGGIPDISDLGELTGGSSSSKDLALYENILLSRKCIEETIIKFNLNAVWEFKYMQDAVKNFRENVMEIKKDKLASMMTINVYYKDPVIARDIANFLISQLNSINTELNIKSAKNNKEFIQARYDTVRAQLKQAEDSLKYYQDKFGLAPELLFKAASQTQIQLEAEIKSEEIKLELLRKILSPDQSEINSQASKIALMKQELENIKQSEAGVSSNLSLKGAPNIVLNFNRLLRDVEIQNKILTFIVPVLEQAKIEEKKETPVVVVLDTPDIAEKKVKPKRVVTILASFIIGLVFASIFVTIRTNYKKFLSTIK